MASTNVVRLKRRGGQVVQGCDVYIGRQMGMGGWQLPASKWGNPYSVKQYGRDQALSLYEQYIRGRPDLIVALPELKGKVLGCWCHPQPCHGHILVKLLQEFYP